MFVLIVQHKVLLMLLDEFNALRNDGVISVEKSVSGRRSVLDSVCVLMCLAQMFCLTVAARCFSPGGLIC